MIQYFFMIFNAKWFIYQNAFTIILFTLDAIVITKFENKDPWYITSKCKILQKSEYISFEYGIIYSLVVYME